LDFHTKNSVVKFFILGFTEHPTVGADSFLKLIPVPVQGIGNGKAGACLDGGQFLDF
jgi:hypothetical protein